MYVSMYMYICMYICCIHVYIYIYIDKKKVGVQTVTCDKYFKYFSLVEKILNHKSGCINR